MIMTELYDRYLQNSKICTDTRKIIKGCLFFALKGPHFNGNKFANEAIKKGAIAIVCSKNCKFYNLLNGVVAIHIGYND